MDGREVAEVVARLRDDGRLVPPLQWLREIREAATLLESEHAARVEAERERDEMNTERAKQVQAYFAERVRAEQAERELAEMRRRVGEAPRGTASVTSDFAGHHFEARVVAQYLHGPGFALDGKRVAVVELREGE